MSKKMTPEEEKEAMQRFSQLLDLGAKALKKVIECIQSLRSESFNLLTYAQVVQELVRNKPNEPTVCKGAALKKEISPGCIEITILYLDANNEPVWGDDPKHPYGCVKKTKQIDSELSAMFDGKDMIIFE